MHLWKFRDRLLAVTSPQARRRAALGGVVAAAAAAAVPFTPPLVHGLWWALLGLAMLWTLVHGWVLVVAQDRERRAALAARWPWMGAGVPPDIAGLADAWRAAGHPKGGLVWGEGVGGAGLGVRWSWVPVAWDVEGAAPDDEGRMPKVAAWALHLVWASGPAVELGRWRPKGAPRPGKGWSPVVFAHPGLARWSVHGRDAVATLRQWSPVAVEAVLAVPEHPLLALDGGGRSCLCVVPPAWVEGDDASPLASLCAALRAAVGPQRWDATVGDAWLPRGEAAPVGGGKEGPTWGLGGGR